MGVRRWRSYRQKCCAICRRTQPVLCRRRPFTNLTKQLFPDSVKVQPNVLDIGCICHLVNLCCVQGVKQLPLPVEELLIDVFFHFNNSAEAVEACQYSVAGWHGKVCHHDATNLTTASWQLAWNCAPCWQQTKRMIWRRPCIFDSVCKFYVADLRLSTR